MAEDRPLDDPGALDRTSPGDPSIQVTFTKGFIERINTLVDHLAGIDHQDPRAAQRAAVGTAVAVLSRYAGKPLYVETDGRLQVIDNLWKSS